MFFVVFISLPAQKNVVCTYCLFATKLLLPRVFAVFVVIRNTLYSLFILFDRLSSAFETKKFKAVICVSNFFKLSLVFGIFFVSFETHYRTRATHLLAH